MSKLIYPDICIVCEKFFENKNNYENYQQISFTNIFNGLMCNDCISKYNILGSLAAEKKTWGKKFNISFINKLSSFFVFQNSIVDIVHLFKYNNRLDLGLRMAYFILDLYLRNHIESKIDCVIPVPMHKVKQRKRGYNQTYILSMHTKFLAAKQHVNFPLVRKNILFKHINTKSQAKLDSGLRKKNLENAFVIKYPYRIKGKRALLIDDVVTTGTTLNECAKVLLNNGALSVDAITFARAL